MDEEAEALGSLSPESFQAQSEDQSTGELQTTLWRRRPLSALQRAEKGATGTSERAGLTGAGTGHGSENGPDERNS